MENEIRIFSVLSTDTSLDTVEIYFKQVRHYLCSFWHLWILQAFSDQWPGNNILCWPIGERDFSVSTNSGVGSVLSRPIRGWHCGRWGAGQELWCCSFRAWLHCEQNLGMQQKHQWLNICATLLAPPYGLLVTKPREICYWRVELLLGQNFIVCKTLSQPLQLPTSINGDIVQKKQIFIWQSSCWCWVKVKRDIAERRKKTKVHGTNSHTSLIL